MYLNRMEENDDEDFESKFITEINCISHVEVKEEVIIPDNVSDGESTLSDNEKNSDVKVEDCVICCKYRSMFIILKNHDCQSDCENCSSCAEISHWLNCFKTHTDTHHSDNEFDNSSDSTVSDPNEEEGICKICKKYEFMVHLLKSHECQYNADHKCSDCNEVLHWMTCYNDHLKSHDSKDGVFKVKEENSSDSTVSDNEEIQKLLSPSEQYECKRCQICLKYHGMLIILEENHFCDINNSIKNCEKCNEILQWSKCFEKHKKTHGGLGVQSAGAPTSKIYRFGKKFDCDICLKLNAVVSRLAKNHKCSNKKSCAVCQEVSYRLSCLKNHKILETVSDLSDSEDLEVVKRVGQEWDCEVCSKFRSTIVSLSRHVCRRKKGREKCEICLQVSHWYKNFKLHENHHGKQVSTFKNYVSCTNCGKRFSSEKILKVHKSYCKTSYFVCDICQKKFVNIFSLKKHKIFQFCRSTPNSSQYSYRVCTKSFSNSSDLKTHEKFHDLKEFKCEDNVPSKFGVK